MQNEQNTQSDILQKKRKKKRMNTCVFQSNKTRLSHYTCSSDTTDGNRNTNTQRIKETESISTHRIHV